MAKLRYHNVDGELVIRDWLGTPPRTLRIPVPTKLRLFTLDEPDRTRSTFRIAEYEGHFIYPPYYDYWRVR